MRTKSDLRTHLASNFNVFTTDDELDEIIDIASEISESKIERTIDINAEEILQYLRDTSNKKIGSTPPNLKFIKARLKEKHSVKLLKQVIEVKCWEWLSNPEMKTYLHPSTLFNATKFSKYCDQVENVKANPQEFKNYVEQRNRQNNQQSSIKADPLDSVRD